MSLSYSTQVPQHNFSKNKVALVADQTNQAQAIAHALEKHYDFSDLEEAEILVVLGGDGFMLECFHRFLHKEVQLFGMNCGSVGFLLNELDDKNLFERIASASPHTIHPLEMKGKLQDGTPIQAYAFNEVSLLRETRQAAKISVFVDGVQRIEQLVADGILLSTPAGSTAYNLSAYGPILPLSSATLALTPISPFRPRRWRGAVLSDHKTLYLRVQEPKKRPVLCVADFQEFRDVAECSISMNFDLKLTLLSDAHYSLEERILMEQFTS